MATADHVRGFRQRHRSEIRRYAKRQAARLRRRAERRVDWRDDDAAIKIRITAGYAD